MVKGQRRQRPSLRDVLAAVPSPERLAVAVAMTLLLACTGQPQPQATPAPTGAASPTDSPAQTPSPTPAAQGPVAPFDEPSRLREVRDDGLRWDRIGFGRRPLARAARDEVIDLDVGAGLLVAGGRHAAAAGAWTSSDGGETWTTVRGLPGAGTGSVDVVTVLEDGSVAMAGAEVDDDSIASAWYSADGSEFRSARISERDVPAGYPFGMLQTPDGVVMLDNAVRVWHSPEGRAWQPVTDNSGEPLLLAPLHLPTGPVRLPDGTLVAVAIGDTVELLRSDDNGTSWTSTGLDVPALQDAHLRRMVRTPGGALVAVGFRLADGADAEEALVVRSDDNGRTWTAGELEGPGAAGPGLQTLTAVAALDGRLVAVGTAGADGRRWPGAWQSDDEGVTWTPIHPGGGVAPRGLEERNQGDTFEDAVAVGDDLVVIGHRDDGQRRDVTVWRLSSGP